MGIHYARAACRIFGAAVDILFPELCVVCGRVILPGRRTGHYPLCADCEDALPVPAGPRCRLCSRPLISEKDVCVGCRRPAGESGADKKTETAGGQCFLKQAAGEQPAKTGGFPFEENRSLFVYQNPCVAELVVSFKGRKRMSLAGFFADKLLAEYKARWDGLPLVPVPCRKLSLKKRGFDPVALLCREMKKRGGVRVLRLLRREGKSREQKTLNRAERLRNLHGAFVPACRNLPAGLTEAVLVDDVFTTGATAAACAETLKKMGIGKVYVLTLALD